MNRLAIASAAVVLLGGVSLATTSSAQAQPQQNENQDYSTNVQTNNPNNFQTNNGTNEIIIVHEGQQYPQLGDLVIEAPPQMQQDLVSIDGSRVGMAGDISDLELVPGSHQLTMTNPSGVTDYQQKVGIGPGQETDVMPGWVANQNKLNPAQLSIQKPLTPSAPGAVIPANSGDLKFSGLAALKNDAVFINGNYAGIAKTVKDLELAPGSYNVALCGPSGETDYQGNVNIVANGTTDLGSVMSGHVVLGS